MRRHFGIRQWKDRKTGEVLATSILKEYPLPMIPHNRWRSLRLMLLFMWDAVFNRKHDKHMQRAMEVSRAVEHAYERSIEEVSNGDRDHHSR